VGPFLKVMIVQENNIDVPTEENEVTDYEIPEYVRLCAELSVDIVLTDERADARIFHLASGSAIFALCIGDIKDSFLVAMPAQLVSENGKVDGKPFTKGKVIRIFKSSLAFVSIPEAEVRNYYYKWLKKNYDSLPSFFSQERRDSIENFVYAFENRSKQAEEQHEDQNDGYRLEDGDTGGSPDSFWSPYTSREFH
jgi:hypothetical protein